MAIEPESKLLLVMDVGTRTAKFQELVQNVEHHVEEEEAAMFPLVEEALASAGQRLRCRDNDQ